MSVRAVLGRRLKAARNPIFQETESGIKVYEGATTQSPYPGLIQRSVRAIALPNGDTGYVFGDAVFDSAEDLMMFLYKVGLARAEGGSIRVAGKKFSSADKAIQYLLGKKFVYRQGEAPPPPKRERKKRDSRRSRRERSRRGRRGDGDDMKPTFPGHIQGHYKLYRTIGKFIGPMEKICPSLKAKSLEQRTKLSWEEALKEMGLSLDKAEKLVERIYDVAEEVTGERYLRDLSRDEFNEIRERSRKIFLEEFDISCPV